MFFFKGPHNNNNDNNSKSTTTNENNKSNNDNIYRSCVMQILLYLYTVFFAKGYIPRLQVQRVHHMPREQELCVFENP